MLSTNLSTTSCKSQSQLLVSKCEAVKVDKSTLAVPFVFADT